jgi:hypothetical protein
MATRSKLRHSSIRNLTTPRWRRAASGRGAPAADRATAACAGDRAADRCSGAQSKCGARAIKGTFGRTIGENIGDHERTLSETERTIGETDARSRKPDAHYLRPEAKSLSD